MHTEHTEHTVSTERDHAPRQHEVWFDGKTTGASPIRAWVRGVPVEDAAKAQLKRLAGLPFIHKWVAAMPDVHLGKGATIGSVIPTQGAIIPAAVGVDLGCGMMAVRTSLRADQLPDDLAPLRAAIEAAVPHGRTDNGGPNDRGAWGDAPALVTQAWAGLADEFGRICEKHPRLARSNSLSHLGTLGTGNHFIELCLDEADRVWVMLHSGSRGVGGRIGSHFISAAKREMERWFIHLPDKDLAYLPEGSTLFNDYMQALAWAQRFARTNRDVMMAHVLAALRSVPALPDFSTGDVAVNCHHNYVSRERHYGAEVWVTRKGAVSAQRGELGIIPGSMGARSYIVRGKGQPEAFCSCSHGAGRAMSRAEAKRRFTLADHAAATAGVECRKDADVIDETPMAYKDID
ncbi:MAG: RtcB family protein, partial [Myxococcales bacterium]|nr:RtcB family protein [Myxococcales bacterium]